MLGAIIGDIVGSAYEFHPTNRYDFEMFAEGSSFTDDTICTVAIADALLRGRDYGESLHEWCRRYMKPKGGYGGRFRKWVESDSPQPYGSFGNGSAMRVSPIAWAFPVMKDAIREAARSAECTHNHHEGVKGAQVVVAAIQRAGKLGKTSAAITKVSLSKAFLPITEHFDYDIDIKRAEVTNRFDETCQGTVPVALWIITESTGFEDAIRKAVSLGADADTLGAIVGSIAEAIWGIPGDLAVKAMSMLPDEMKDVVLQFYRKYDLIENSPLRNYGDEGAAEDTLTKEERLEREAKEREAERQRKRLQREQEAQYKLGDSKWVMRCVVAGTQYIENQRIFYDFGTWDVLTVKREQNKYDSHAVALYFNDEKIGYIPRSHNAQIAAIIDCGWDKMFHAVVKDWQGCDAKRKITVDIYARPQEQVVDEIYCPKEFEFNEKLFKAYQSAEFNQMYFSAGGKTGMLAGRTAPYCIDRLAKNEIFVFGSNAEGHHSGGAARVAMKRFGAVWGQGNGLQGQSYAINTTAGFAEMALHINGFVYFAAQHQEYRFFVTPIGCGNAGYNPLHVAPLFRHAILLPNVFLPRIFWEYYWMTDQYHPEFFTPSDVWKKWIPHI